MRLKVMPKKRRETSAIKQTTRVVIVINSQIYWMVVTHRRWWWSLPSYVIGCSLEEYRGAVLGLVYKILFRFFIKHFGPWVGSDYMAQTLLCFLLRVFKRFGPMFGLGHMNQTLLPSYFQQTRNFHHSCCTCHGRNINSGHHIGNGKQRHKTRYGKL